MRTERICHYELLEKNILQDLSDRTENRPAVPALSKTQDCRQCKSPAGYYPEEKMQQSPDHHDAGIRKLGLTRRLEAALTNAGIPFCIYDKTVETLPQTMYPRP